MKFSFPVFTVLIMSTALWAQGGEGGDVCDVWYFTVRDYSCSSTGCTGTYQSGTFTAPNCPHFYISCGGHHSDGSASNCPLVTVKLYPGTGIVDPIAICYNWSQEPQYCGGESGSNRVSLQPGASYFMTVCFEPCPNYTCQNCQGDYAEGKIWVQQ
jgi:hypothetical protein